MSQSTISQLIDNFSRQLKTQFDTGKLDAEVLVAYALNLSRTQLYTWSDRLVSDDNWLTIDSLITRRMNGEPIAYITGKQEFWSLEFQVTPATLIPRPETELLVELALQKIPNDVVWKIADLGTGSGAIALALAKERPASHVLALDKSTAALTIAKKNAEMLGVANISFEQSDWFGALGSEKFDLIVSNPPYIEDSDKHLTQGDVASEPRSALASGVDGLDDIRQIIVQAKNYLNPTSVILIEHGWNQAEKVRALFEEAVYDNVCSYKDLAGIERVTMAVNN